MYYKKGKILELNPSIQPQYLFVYFSVIILKNIENNTFHIVVRYQKIFYDCYGNLCCLIIRRMKFSCWNATECNGFYFVLWTAPLYTFIAVAKPRMIVPAYMYFPPSFGIHCQKCFIHFSFTISDYRLIICLLK